MRRESMTLLLPAALVMLLSAPSLEACGDKLLVLGRGAKFQRNIAEHPASILHYMDPAKNGTIGDSKLRSSLEQAGHRLQSVRSAKEFEDALRTGQYEIVLIDFVEAPVFEASIRAAASRPLLLPTVETGKKADHEAAKRQYGLVLKAPARVVHLLDTIDDAMKLRQERQRKAA